MKELEASYHYTCRAIGLVYAVLNHESEFGESAQTKRLEQILKHLEEVSAELLEAKKEQKK